MYRKRVLKELKDFYSKSVRELTQEDTDQLEQMINNKFVKDYPEFEKIEDFGTRWMEVILDFIPEERIPQMTKIKIYNRTKNDSNR